MGTYRLEGPKPARMYEVILPKKLGYFGKVQEVLEDLFDEAAIRSVPSVQRRIAEARRRNADFDEEAWIKTLCQASRGYSIYEMDGRYLSPSGPVDERVLVFRFIFHNPTGAEPTPGPTSWPPRWRSSTTWSPTGSPRSWGSRRRSGSWSTPSPAWPSGGRPSTTTPTRDRPHPDPDRRPHVDPRRADRPLRARRDRCWPTPSRASTDDHETGPARPRRLEHRRAGRPPARQRPRRRPTASSG